MFPVKSYYHIFCLLIHIIYIALVLFNNLIFFFIYLFLLICLAHRSQSSPNMAANGTSDTKSVAPPSLAVIYQKLACLLLDTINEAVQSTNDRKVRSSFKMVRGTENDTKDFADLYDLNEKEILGMGRFGMVFGGTMRRNGVRVAIKKILTNQCSQKDRENIEQEAAYLFQLNHPGLLINFKNKNYILLFL